MKTLIVGIVAATALLTGCASRGSVTNAAADRQFGGNLETTFSSMLSGNWTGSSPGNDLRLDIDSVIIRSLSHPHDLFLRVTGAFQGTNIGQSGYLHLQNQGDDLFVGFIPHFDPTVTSMSREAGRFTSSETNAACSFYVTPRGDGFVGETRGSTTCALAIRGAVGKWVLEVEPGTLAVRHAESGETLRFRKSSR